MHSRNSSNSSLDYAEVFKMVLRQRLWLIGFLTAGLFAARIFLWLAEPIYIASASIKLEDRRYELSELLQVRNFYDRVNRTESERLILKSRTVLTMALASLDYKVAFLTRDKFRLQETYPHEPLKISVGKLPASLPRNEFVFSRIGHSNKYHLTWQLGQLRSSGTYQFGEKIRLAGLQFTIRKNGNSPTTCVFRFISPMALAQRITSALHVNDVQNGNMINLQIRDPDPEFAKDALNAVLESYLTFDKAQRTRSINQSKAFLTQILGDIDQKTSNSGASVQKYKENQRIKTISSTLNEQNEQLSALNTHRQTLRMNRLSIAELGLRLSSPDSNGIVSYGLEAIADEQLKHLFSQHNDLLQKRQTLLTVQRPSAPAVKNIDEQILFCKKAITSKVNTQKHHIDGLLRLIDYQLDSLQDYSSRFPGIERRLNSLESKFEVNKKIHDYLLEKNLEAEISGAAVVPGAFIVDKAVAPAEASFPVPARVYTLAALTSCAMGVLFIFHISKTPYLLQGDNIEELTDVPVLSTIQKYTASLPSAHILPVYDDPRSATAESFRMLRSRINFLCPNKPNKIICVTSEISGEGKSFVAANLAVALTLINKKVLLVSADLRRPGLSQMLKSQRTIGLSQFLSKQVGLNEIISATKIGNLDFIDSGPLPPNPAELLHSKEMRDVLDHLKEHYDYMIIDSAPTGLVADSAELIQYSDINLFILRYGVSRKNLSATMGALQTNTPVPNLYLVLNEHKRDKLYMSYYNNQDNN